MPRLRLPLVCLLIAEFATLISSRAIAQTEPLQEITVVGSRIPQRQDQALPITVISSEQLEQRGYTTVQQALDDLAQNSGGGFDQQLTFGFTPSAAGVNLRDLGVGRALILLDGRRMPMFPIGWNGTDSFVDLSGIPAGAVQRIEVLPGGASAIYGSDALSGVINIVLKRRADNEISLRYGDTFRGGGTEKRVQASAGAATDDASASLFVEYYRRDPLYYSQRARTRSDRLGGINGSGPGNFSPYGYPGTFISDSLGVSTPGGCDASSGSPGIDADGFCLFNRAAYREVWPDSRSFSATAKLDQNITEHVSWFTMLMLRDSKTTVQTEPLDFNSLFDVGAPLADNTIVYRRLLELGPQRSEYDNHAYNVHAGLKGQWLDRFDWQLAVQSARLQLESIQSGLIRNDRMFDALVGNIDYNGDGIADPLDLSRRIPDAYAAQLAYRPVSLSESKLQGADFQLTGKVFELPAGSAKVALTVEHLRESYFDHPDPQLIAANVSYLKAVAAGGQRSHDGAGVELQLPLLTQLQLNLAGRYDDYQDDSDVGGAFSPRAELRYRPSSAWLVRGSVGRNFRAPDMQRLYGGATSGYVELVNTIQCRAQGGSGRGDASVASCVDPVFVGLTTNSSLALKEERGNQYNVGVFWKPDDSWSASLDYFAINLRQLVQTPDGQYVLDQNANGQGFDSAVIAGFTAGCPFTEVCLSLQPLNISYKKVSGLDASAEYRWSSPAGRFSLGVDSEYLIDVSMRESAFRAPVNVLQEGKLGEAVRLKGGVDLGWERGAWGSNLHLSYIGGLAPLDTTTQKRLGSFTTVNWSVRYLLFAGTNVQLGVNNVFDRMPPVDVSGGSRSAPFYHQQFHNVDGASWYASLRQRF